MYRVQAPAVYVHESVWRIPDAAARAERLPAAIEGPAPIFPNGKQIFPHEARARIYRFFLQEIRRHNASVPVSLCGETPEMWEELGPELGMTPESYHCACGPTSTPDELAGG